MGAFGWWLMDIILGDDMGKKVSENLIRTWLFSLFKIVGLSLIIEGKSQSWIGRWLL